MTQKKKNISSHPRQLRPCGPAPPRRRAGHTGPHGAASRGAATCRTHCCDLGEASDEKTDWTMKNGDFSAEIVATSSSN